MVPTILRNRVDHARPALQALPADRKERITHLLLALVCFLPAVLFLSVACNRVPALDIQVDQPHKNLGKIPQFSTVRAVFRLQNKGQHTLFLRQFQGSCSCMKQLPKSLRLLPGAVETLPVDVNVGSHMGVLKETILCQISNGGSKTAPLEFSITVDVTPLLAVVPKQIDFTTAPADPVAGNTRRVLIRGNSLEFRIRKVYSNHTSVRLDSCKRLVGNGEFPVYVVTARLAESSSAPTRVSGSVHLTVVTEGPPSQFPIPILMPTSP